MNKQTQINNQINKYESTQVNKMKKNTMAITITASLLIILAALFIIPSGVAPNTPGPNYKNVTVWTHANITNAKPEVLNVSIYEVLNTSARNITITAGDTKKIYCNATVRDWNGFSDIVYLNASIWHNVTSSYTAADDYNNHYTNSSCVFNGSLSSNTGWYVCSFDVYYFSNNGTWTCNATVMDTYNKTGSRTNTTVFYPVYAINVTDGIDYGEVAVEDTTPDIIANMTNLGNMAINITVEGYGTRKGDGLAMNCSINGNITVDNEKFALSSGVAYGAKTALNASGPVNMTGLTMPKQTVLGTPIINTTYWQLYVPPNPAGNCTGFVIFTAMAP
jgi:hypothetical protein